jgi:hypothetical protein
MTSTIFYNQHELTPTEIRADETRNAAIARNRGTTTPKPFKFRDPGAPANDAQKGKIRMLLSELRRVDYATWEKASEWIDTNLENPTVFTMEMASKTIDRLRLRIEEAGNRPDHTHRVLGGPDEKIICTHGAPYGNGCNPSPTAYVRPPRDSFADVPDGYYAVLADEGHLAFYRVSTWKKSGDRKVQVKASDALHLIKGYKATDAILAKIRRDTPAIAGRLFARELKQCYRCGRDLTDAESRGNGLGPVCINK